MRTLSFSPLLPLMFLAACTGESTTDSGKTTPTGTDNDADTDADADSDADSDADVAPPHTFAGQVSFSVTLNGEPVCDAEATLAGTAYVGECVGCDFAVEIDDTVTAENNLSSCSSLAPYAYVETGEYGFYDLIMAHAPEWSAYYYDYYYDYVNMEYVYLYGYNYYDDALLTGYSYLYDYFGYPYDFPGPYFRVTSYTDAPYTTFTRTGDNIAWTFTDSYSYTEYAYTYFSYCAAVADTSTGTAPGVAGDGEASSLDCTGDVVDVWSFDADGTASVQLAADTVADATAFDPHLYIAGGDECLIGYADDSFDCTYPPPDFQCPAVDLGVLAAGSYTVSVRSYGSCAGTSAEYELRTAGATNVILTHDSAPAISIVGTNEYVYSVSGEGQVTAE